MLAVEPSAVMIAQRAPGTAPVVRVEAEPGSHGDVALRVHADPADLGRIIGRRGRVIQAVRQVARAAGALDEVTTTVDVVE